MTISRPRAGEVERYVRAPVEIRLPDPRAPAVAGHVGRLIAAARPGTVVEHVGSSAVAGLAGKGTIDLLIATVAAEVPRIAEALLALGFQLQDEPRTFPPSRPMLQGVVRHGGDPFRVHVHVVPLRREAAALRGFRDALRADPRLRREYEALKRAIVAGGVSDPVAFSNAKHDFIRRTLRRLGLGDGRR
jgi:GrpB-like predicted nucleotidyltransferase (UPF0157 family)